MENFDEHGGPLFSNGKTTEMGRPCYSNGEGQPPPSPIAYDLLAEQNMNISKTGHHF